MRRPAITSVVVSALSLAAIGVVLVAPAFSSNSCQHAHPHMQQMACRDSLMPPKYSIHDMGMDDYGGGSRNYHGPVHSVASLLGPKGPPDVSYTLTAAFQEVKVAGHRQRVYTLNGTSPGPTVYAEQGDLVRVVLKNRNIKAGTTIHWHGMDIPNGEDGVAGVTQNAVLPGQQFVYRFRATDAGTYWYHSHQYAQQQVTQGLVGAVVVQPQGSPTPPASAADVTALVHSYRGHNTINGLTGVRAVGGDVDGRRIRFINTNQGAMQVGVERALPSGRRRRR